MGRKSSLERWRIRGKSWGWGGSFSVFVTWVGRGYKYVVREGQSPLGRIPWRFAHGCLKVLGGQVPSSSREGSYGKGDGNERVQFMDTGLEKHPSLRRGKWEEGKGSGIRNSKNNLGRQRALSEQWRLWHSSVSVQKVYYSNLVRSRAQGRSLNLATSSQASLEN